MVRKLSITELIVTIIASSALAAAALVLSLKLTIAPAYPDFIAGDIAWQAQTKFQDLIAAPVFVLVWFSGFWAFSQVMIRLEKGLGKPSSEELVTQLLWWSIPFVVAVGGLILAPSADENFFFLSAAGLIGVGATSGFNLSRGTQLSPYSFGLALLAVLLSALIPMELALILGRAPMRLVGEVHTSSFLVASYSLAGIGFIVVNAMAIVSPGRLYRRTPEFLLIGQIGLPLLFLTLYPARLDAPDKLTKYSTTFGLKALTLGLLFWGVFDVIRWYLKSRPLSKGHGGSLLSPVALFALLTALKLGNTVPPKISPDDYHFGETLLGWWSYLHGAIPYVDYLPAHGLIQDDWAGFLSFLFYDGTAGSVDDAARLGYAFFAFVAFISLYRFSNSLGFAFVSIMSILFTGWGGASQRALFFTPFLCLWFSESLRGNPVRWFSVWILTAPLVILGAPGEGLLLVTASGILVLQNVWHLWIHPEKGSWKKQGVTAAVLLVVLIVTPMARMLFAAIRYVLENGPINQVVWGIPWDFRRNVNATTGLVFEAIRMSWIAIPLICLTIVYSVSKDHSNRGKILPPAMVVLLFTLLLIPYSMGRVDPGVSRPGLVAIYGWAVLIPIVIWPLTKPLNRVALILLIAGMSAALNFTSLSLSSLTSAVSSKIVTGPLRDGRSAGLANLGMATVQDEHWDRLLKLNALLTQELSPNETFLDLSSRQAQYFYLNRKPAMVVTAPYNMVPLPQQRRAVAALLSNPPRLALLEGGGLSLRNPLLYRFVVDNYIPTIEGGFTVGYRKQDAVRAVRIFIKDLTDSNWERGVSRNGAAVILGDTTLLPMLTEGIQVLFGNGELRKITRVWMEGNAIYLDGASLDPSKVGAPHFIEVKVDPKIEAEYRIALFEKAFGIPDLAKIPVAWGRSEKSLHKRMRLIGKLGPVAPVTHDLILESGYYKITGNDPIMNFDISSLGASGRNAGLLRFDFSCLNKKTDPRIQVFWWGDVPGGPTEASSLKFTADNGALIVPMDAYPRWLTLENIRGIRIDLDNAVACEAIKVSNVALYQRKAVAE